MAYVSDHMVLPDIWLWYVIYMSTFRTILFHHIVGTVSFKELVYTVNENNGSLQPELILSNPLSMDVTVDIDSFDGSAKGK